MRRTVLIMFLFFAQSKSIGQVALEDSLCLQNKVLAQEDYDKGIYKLCTNAEWVLPFSRMFKILDSLCGVHKIFFAPYPFIEHDYGFDPYSCYSEFMDSVLSKKYGKDFKDELIRKADEIYKIKHNKDTIPWYHCDTGIQYAKGSEEDLDSAFFKGMTFPASCQSSSVYNISFIVDTEGKAFRFKIIDSKGFQDACAKSIKQRLLQSAKKFTYWKPAMLGDKKVACHANFIVDITSRHVIAE